MSLLLLLHWWSHFAGTKAVKTATVQTEVIDGFQILRSKDCTSTMQSLVAWTKALKRKYDHLTVSCHAAASDCSGCLVVMDRNGAMRVSIGSILT